MKRSKKRLIKIISFFMAVIMLVTTVSLLFLASATEVEEVKPTVDVSPINVEVTTENSVDKNIIVADNPGSPTEGTYYLANAQLAVEEAIRRSQNFSSIKIGDRIAMGKYNGEVIFWRCVDIDENGPLMLSEKVLCNKEFDAAGDNEQYHSDGWGYIRKNRGSNCWSDSNIRQWLNTSGTVTYSHCPPSYANENGFMTSFTDSELALIQTVTQKTYVNSWEQQRNGYVDGGSRESSDTTDIPSLNKDYSDFWYQLCTDRFFLLNQEQIYNAYNNNPNFVYNDSKYFTRIACNSGASYENLQIISNTNKIYYTAASDSSIGIRPAFYLNENYLYGLTPKEKAKLYIESLDIIYTGTDNANRVTQDIGLETENPYGLEVKWSSSNINVISCKGNVVRQENDTNVKISVGVYYEQRGNVLFGYSKTFDLIVTGTGGTLPSEPVNGEYIKFQTLGESDAVNLLKFISKDLTDTDVKNKLSDFYRLLVGDLQNQPEYEQKVKVAFVDFVYICINSRPISNDYKINFATTALKTWLDDKGGEGTVIQPFVEDAVEIIKSAFKKGILLDNGIELPDMPESYDIVQNFFDWSFVTINSIGGFLAIRDKAQIQYLSTYLKNRDSEYLYLYLDTAALDINGFDGPQIREKLERWGETIYQIEKSLESNVKTTYIAKCPVVMEVYDSSGEMIAILDNDKEGALYNPYGAFQVVKEPGTQDFIKIARLYSDDCYVKIRGVGNGEMNLTVEEAQNNGETKNFEVTLPVSNSTEFTVLRGETTPRITVHDLNSETLDEAVQMAEIDRNKYSVTATSTDGGFVLGGETAYEGSDIILTAYPEDDYAFAGWYENGKLISNEECISITLNENRNFHAVFYCPVTGITLDKTNITLKIGESAEILPKLSPQNASNKAVSWKLSNPNVVSVDEKGNVKAIASGSAIITAMTKDGGYTATCVVNVLKPDFNVTINGNVVKGDVACVKLPSAFTLYKNFYATLGFSLDSEVEVQSVKWNYANWSQANPEANIESPNSFETIIRPNGKGIGARSTWITVTVTDIYGNVYSDTIKVRFYKWDWQI